MIFFLILIVLRIKQNLMSSLQNNKNILLEFIVIFINKYVSPAISSKKKNSRKHNFIDTIVMSDFHLKMKLFTCSILVLNEFNLKIKTIY